MAGPIIDVRNVSRTYQTASGPLTVLSEVTFTISPGASCAIVGPSGSGKTTLLGLLAGLDHPSKGELYVLGHALHKMSEDKLAELRNRQIGFVFQNFQLLPTLTALENVLVPLELRGEKRGAGKAKELLARVGLGERMKHYPVQLSGGEQQRVALARAFIGKPDILFADEPTGNLDEDSSRMVEGMLFELNRESAATLVMVTHNLELARKTHLVLRMRGGRLVAQGEHQRQEAAAIP